MKIILLLLIFVSGCSRENEKLSSIQDFRNTIQDHITEHGHPPCNINAVLTLMKDKNEFLRCYQVLNYNPKRSIQDYDKVKTRAILKDKKSGHIIFFNLDGSVSVK